MSAPALYAHPFSSYCQKVFIAFHEKNAPYQLIQPGAEPPDAGADFTSQWPFHQFPILRTENGIIAESSIIIEWLDQHTPTAAPLIPADPDAALRVRTLDRVFDNYIMNPVSSFFADHFRPADSRDPFGLSQSRATLDRAYAWLETQLTNRTWAAGEHFTMADCAAAPALFYATWVHPFTAHPTLSAYYARLLARPSFARCVEDGRAHRGVSPIPAPPGCP